MKIKNWALLLAGFSLSGVVGCEQTNGKIPREIGLNAASNKSLQLASESPSDVVKLLIEPSPELRQAVERGDVRPADPVTEERFRQWWHQAELRVQVECQQAQVRYFRELLRLADESEQEFLGRFGVGPNSNGTAAARQLESFQLVRRRVSRDLQLAEANLHQWEHKLARLESRISPTDSASRTNSQIIQTGAQVMTQHSLSGLGLSDTRVRRLEDRGIRTMSDLARDFYLPEQHALLAELLEIDAVAAQDLVQRATEAISPDELAALIREARQPRAFGVLPPNGLGNKE